MVTVRRYQKSDRDIWDSFVRGATARLFFFERAYMEYHSDRFIDESLIASKGDDVVALMPATRNGSVLVSHGGLTFGGLLLNARSRAEIVLAVFEAILEYGRREGIERIIYKAIPYIFHRQPAQEDLYALYLLDARLVRRDISSAIRLSHPRKLSKGRRWSVSRARREGVEVGVSDDWRAFHSLLSHVLERHERVPVHTVAELEYLAKSFPERLSLRVARKDGELMAATLLFLFDQVMHTQYIATSDTGKEFGALDFLLQHSIEEAGDRAIPYFSFGISTESDGRLLNRGLIAHKEGFGASGIAVDHYELEVT